MARIIRPPGPNPEKPQPDPQPQRVGYVIGSFGNASIDQWDDAFIKASHAVKAKKGVRVDPRVMKAMMDVEAKKGPWGDKGNYPPDQCRDADGYDAVPACGPMQIKRRYHFHRCPECDFGTVPGQIELATHIIGDTMLERGRDEYDAIVTTYFPGGDVNGTTQKAYVDRVRKLVGIMEHDVIGPPSAPPPTPPVGEADILNLISNNAPGVYISFPFRGKGNAIYAYGKGHGTTASNEHSGIDIWMPDETPVSAVFGGEVVCVGTAGRGLWGQGCGYFSDDNGGLGNITVLSSVDAILDGKRRNQLKITYGHMSSAAVRLGQTVTAGQRIGRSGVGGGWPHVHLDVAINAPELNNPQIWNNPGEYHLLDPIPAIIAALGGKPMPTVYPAPYDVPQPNEMDRFATVYVEEDNLPVFQRASRQSPETHDRLKKGDDFLGAMKIMGPDGEIFWITSNKNRVPVKGTRSDDWKE